MDVATINKVLGVTDIPKTKYESKAQGIDIWWLWDTLIVETGQESTTLVLVRLGVRTSMKMLGGC